MSIEKRLIGEIENGIVIDHLPPGAVWRVANILGLSTDIRGRVSVGDNYDSKKLKGKKGVIKIEGRSLSHKELSRIVLVAPYASVSRIENGKVVSKERVETPEVLEGVAKCLNPKCISVFIPPGASVPEVVSKMGYLGDDGFECLYCERPYTRKELVENMS